MLINFFVKIFFFIFIFINFYFLAMDFKVTDSLEYKKNLREKIINLIDSKSDLNKCYIIQGIYDYPLIHLAGKCQNDDLFELLLNSGANPNLSWSSRSVIGLEIKNNNLMRIKLLMNYGVDLKLDNNNNFIKSNLLIECITNCNINFDTFEILEILLKKNIDPNEQDYEGNTPLNYCIMAIKRDFIEQVIFIEPRLKNYRIDNLKIYDIQSREILLNYLKKFALPICYYLYKQLIIILLFYKADPEIKNNNNESFMDIAYLYRFDDLIDSVKSIQKQLNSNLN